jgi:3-isopropylmalate/(R)-2-methylmalate dehydratase small subunit
MSDATRTVITAPAIPVRGHDIDTDRIIPARFLKCVVFEGLGHHVFEDDRRQDAAAGRIHPFDDPRFQTARILLANRNFGCGSSREHAPQAIMRWGRWIQAVVAESFAEIFFGNCTALGLPCLTIDSAAMATLMDLVSAQPETPVTVDLTTMQVTAGTQRTPAQMPAGARQQLLAGSWDTTGELLAGKEAVAAVAARLAYFNRAPAVRA